MHRLNTLSKHTSTLDSLWGPTAYSAVVLTIDHFFDSLLLTPLLFGFLLVFLAFRLKPISLTFWAAFSLLLVVYSLVTHCDKGSADISSNAVVAARTASFSIVCFLALLLCVTKSRLFFSYRSALTVLEGIPSALFLSDADGNILFANSEGLEMIGRTADNTLGLSFFSILSPPNDKGIAVYDYLALIDDKDPGRPKKNFVYVRDRNAKSHSALQFPIYFMNKRCVATAIVPMQDHSLNEI